ncbi:MAG: hypothetical protein NVS2B16_32370 [Chloroflexota bacterium]
MRSQAEETDDAAQREIKVVLAAETLLNLPDRQTFDRPHGGDCGNEARTETMTTETASSQARDGREAAGPAVGALATDQDVLGDDGALRSRDLDHLHPAMHPSSGERPPAPRTRRHAMGHLLVDPIHSLSPMVVPPISLGPGRRFLLLLGPFARPWLGLMLWWSPHSRQPLVLGLERCHLLPEEGILLLQATDQLLLLGGNPPQFGILPLELEDTFVLAGQPGSETGNLLLQLLSRCPLVCQQHPQRRGIVRAKGEALVHRETILRLSHPQVKSKFSRFLNSYNQFSRLTYTLKRTTIHPRN